MWKKIAFLATTVFLAVSLIQNPTFALRPRPALERVSEGGFETLFDKRQTADDGGDNTFVDALIRERIGARAPDWIAHNYRPGRIFISTDPATADSIHERIRGAKVHLAKATQDSFVRERVEKALGILAAHPHAPEMMIVEFEGLTHRLVKQLTGNEDPYKEYKRQLDEAMQPLYLEVRNTLTSIPDRREAIRTAMTYAGIVNLLDPAHVTGVKGITETLGMSLDFNRPITVDDLKVLVSKVFERVQTETIIVDEVDAFLARLERNSGKTILYFLDNHGEIIFDQLVIEQLLLAGYRVAGVGRGEMARDDVTREEAEEILRANPHLQPFLADGRLTVVTDGSYLVGADLTQSSRHPDFLAAWQDATAYIAKGAGNFQSLFGQHLSLPGLYIRMVKSSKNAYRLLEEARGTKLTRRTPFDLALIYQPEDFSPPRDARDARDGGRQEDLASLVLEARIRSTGKEVFRNLAPKGKLGKIRVTPNAWRDFFVQYGMQEGLRERILAFLNEFPNLTTPLEVKEAIRRHFPLGEVPKPMAKALRLFEHLPARKRRAVAEAVIRFVARRYIAGETLGKTIPKLKKLRRRGVAFTLDPVGEKVTKIRDASMNAEDLISLTGSLHEYTRKWESNPFLDVPYLSHVSLKLTSLTTSFDRAHKQEVKDKLRQQVRMARQKGVFIRIDMEEYKYKDPTLEIFKELLEEEEFLDYEGLGIVLQAYLKDSVEDISSLTAFAHKRLARKGSRTPIRLVKGAYPDWEKEEAKRQGYPSPVWDEKWETDENFEVLSRKLLEHADAIRPAFGTHNIRSISHILAYANLLHLSKSSFEFQFLYGMGEPIQRALVRAGYRVRAYVPYGPFEKGIPYLVRRLIENSSQLSFLRQSLSGDYDLEELLKPPREFANAADGALRQARDGAGRQDTTQAHPVLWQIPTEALEPSLYP